MTPSHKSYFRNRFGARVQLVKSQNGKPLHWLFLPGGPGLGSEYLRSLVSKLDLPGSLWLVDFPGDGSNTFSDNTEAFKKWNEALVDVVNGFENVILVGHSSGGMFALAEPRLAELLTGLILMDSAPNSSWQTCLAKMFADSPLPGFDKVNERFMKNPCNETLKDLTVASAPYFFTKEGLEEGAALLASLPYNYETFIWSDKNFDSTYKALWVPENIPTLILAGSEDTLTPLSLFEEAKAFNRPNIVMKEIPDAGHFPWIENFDDLYATLISYAETL